MQDAWSLEKPGGDFRLKAPNYFANAINNSYISNLFYFYSKNRVSIEDNPSFDLWGLKLLYHSSSLLIMPYNYRALMGSLKGELPHAGFFEHSRS